MKLHRQAILFCIISGLLFLLLSTLAMAYYPGGTIHDRGTIGYSFWHNYFNDLGRMRSWSGAPNGRSNLFFQSGLLLAGSGLAAFFLVLPALFRDADAKMLALASSVAGMVAALCYAGIALTPLDAHYGRHTVFVRAGFIAFLAMALFYSLAIRRQQEYPNHYARAFGWFSAILGIQIAIMLFGPRAWRSPEALLLQASAQKVVVYAEIICMAYQGVGAYRMAGRLMGQQQV